MEKQAVVITEKDSVAVATVDLTKGSKAKMQRNEGRYSFSNEYAIQRS